MKCDGDYSCIIVCNLQERRAKPKGGTKILEQTTFELNTDHAFT